MSVSTPTTNDRRQNGVCSCGPLKYTKVVRTITNVIDYASQPFVMIARNVMVSPELTPNDKVVYAILCAHASNGGKQTYINIETIRKMANLGRSTAARSIISVEKAALDRVEPSALVTEGRQVSNLYTVLALPKDFAKLVP